MGRSRSAKSFGWSSTWAGRLLSVHSSVDRSACPSSSPILQRPSLWDGFTPEPPSTRGGSWSRGRDCRCGGGGPVGPPLSPQNPQPDLPAGALLNDGKVGGP